MCPSSPNVLYVAKALLFWKSIIFGVTMKQSTNLNIQSFRISYALKNSSQWNGICRVKKFVRRKKFNENESITRTSHKIVQKIIERGKPFTDGNYIKECLMEAVNELCPKNSMIFCSNLARDHRFTLSSGPLKKKFGDPCIKVKRLLVRM